MVAVELAGVGITFGIGLALAWLPLRLPGQHRVLPDLVANALNDRQSISLGSMGGTGWGLVDRAEVGCNLKRAIRPKRAIRFDTAWRASEWDFIVKAPTRWRAGAYKDVIQHS